MKPIIGAHVSAAGGLYTVFANAKRIGAECIQMFGASPRQWAAPIPQASVIKQFKDAWKLTPEIKAVYLHAPYLNNLASTDPMMLKKSIANLSAHLQIAELLGANGLIFHVGSGKESNQDEAMARAIVAMKEILKNVPGTAQLIVENAAGGGAKLGDNAKEMGQLVRGPKSERMKACLDTAHAFESGIIESYSPKNIKTLFDELDKEMGLEHLVALHTNDSKTAFNSKHDRHENIGEGYIGKEAFSNLYKEKRIAHTHWLLEVPGFDDMGPDKRNVDIMHAVTGA